MVGPPGRRLSANNPNPFLGKNGGTTTGTSTANVSSSLPGDHSEPHGASADARGSPQRAVGAGFSLSPKSPKRGTKSIKDLSQLFSGGAAAGAASTSGSTTGAASSSSSSSCRLMSSSSTHGAGGGFGAAVTTASRDVDKNPPGRSLGGAPRTAKHSSSSCSKPDAPGGRKATTSSSTTTSSHSPGKKAADSWITSNQNRSMLTPDRDLSAGKSSCSPKKTSEQARDGQEVEGGPRPRTSVVSCGPPGAAVKPAEINLSAPPGAGGFKGPPRRKPSTVVTGPLVGSLAAEGNKAKGSSSRTGSASPANKSSHVETISKAPSETHTKTPERPKSPEQPHVEASDSLAEVPVAAGNGSEKATSSCSGSPTRSPLSLKQRTKLMNQNNRGPAPASYQPQIVRTPKLRPLNKRKSDIVDRDQASSSKPFRPKARTSSLEADEEEVPKKSEGGVVTCSRTNTDLQLSTTGTKPDVLKDVENPSTTLTKTPVPGETDENPDVDKAELNHDDAGANNPTCHDHPVEDAIGISAAGKVVAASHNYTTTAFDIVSGADVKEMLSFPSQSTAGAAMKEEAYESAGGGAHNSAAADEAKQEDVAPPSSENTARNFQDADAPTPDPEDDAVSELVIVSTRGRDDEEQPSGSSVSTDLGPEKVRNRDSGEERYGNEAQADADGEAAMNTCPVPVTVLSASPPKTGDEAEAGGGARPVGSGTEPASNANEHNATSDGKEEKRTEEGEEDEICVDGEPLVLPPATAAPAAQSETLPGPGAQLQHDCSTTSVISEEQVAELRRQVAVLQESLAEKDRRLKSQDEHIAQLTELQKDATLETSASCKSTAPSNLGSSSGVGVFLPTPAGPPEIASGAGISMVGSALRKQNSTELRGSCTQAILLETSSSAAPTSASNSNKEATTRTRGPFSIGLSAQQTTLSAAPQSAARTPQEEQSSFLSANDISPVDDNKSVCEYLSSALSSSNAGSAVASPAENIAIVTPVATTLSDHDSSAPAETDSGPLSEKESARCDTTSATSAVLLSSASSSKESSTSSASGSRASTVCSAAVEEKVRAELEQKFREEQERWKKANAELQTELERLKAGSAEIQVVSNKGGAENATAISESEPRKSVAPVLAEDPQEDEDELVCLRRKITQLEEELRTAKSFSSRSASTPDAGDSERSSGSQAAGAFSLGVVKPLVLHVAPACPPGGEHEDVPKIEAASDVPTADTGVPSNGAGNAGKGKGTGKMKGPPPPPVQPSSTSPAIEGAASSTSCETPSVVSDVRSSSSTVAGLTTKGKPGAAPLPGPKGGQKAAPPPPPLGPAVACGKSSAPPLEASCATSSSTTCSKGKTKGAAVPAAGKPQTGPSPPGGGKKGAAAPPGAGAVGSKKGGGKGGKGKHNRAPPLPRSNGFINIPWAVISETASERTQEQLEKTVGDFLGPLYNVGNILGEVQVAATPEDVDNTETNEEHDTSRPVDEQRNLGRTAGPVLNNRGGCRNNPPGGGVLVLPTINENTPASSPSAASTSSASATPAASCTTPARQTEAPKKRKAASLWSRKLVSKVLIQDRMLSFFKKVPATSTGLAAGGVGGSKPGSAKNSPLDDDCASGEQGGKSGDASTKKLCLIDGKLVQHGEILWRQIVKEFPAKDSLETCEKFRNAFLNCTLKSPDSLASIRPLIDCVAEALEQQDSDNGKESLLALRKNDESLKKKFQYPHLHKLCFDVISISGYDERIDVLIYKLEFYQQESELRARIQVVRKAIDVLISKKHVLRKLFQLIQDLGNKLNAGCQAPTAEHGFRLTSLQKICEIKCASLTATILHFVLCMMGEEDSMVFTDADCKALREARSVRTYAIYDRTKDLLQPMSELKELVSTNTYNKKQIKRRRETIGGQVDKKDRFHEEIEGFLLGAASNERELRRETEQFFARYLQLGVFFNDLQTVWPPPSKESDPTKDLFEIFDVFAEKVRAVQKDLGFHVDPHQQGRKSLNRSSTTMLVARDQAEVKNVSMLREYIQSSCLKADPEEEAQPQLETVESFVRGGKSSSPNTASRTASATNRGDDRLSPPSSPEGNKTSPIRFSACPPKRKTAPAVVADRCLAQFREINTAPVRVVAQEKVATTSALPSPVESQGSSDQHNMSDVSAWSPDEENRSVSLTEPHQVLEPQQDEPESTSTKIAVSEAPRRTDGTTTLGAADDGRDDKIDQAKKANSSPATKGKVSSGADHAPQLRGADVDNENEASKTAISVADPPFPQRSKFMKRDGAPAAKAVRFFNGAPAAKAVRFFAEEPEEEGSTGAAHLQFHGSRSSLLKMPDCANKNNQLPHDGSFSNSTSAAQHMGHITASVPSPAQEDSGSTSPQTTLPSPLQRMTTRPGRKPSVYNNRKPRKSLSAFADRVTQRNKLVVNTDQEQEQEQQPQYSTAQEQ